MSADIVDDLHAAEDRIGLLEATLREFLELDDSGDFTDLVVDKRSVLADTYCRPSCHGTYIVPPDYVDERGTTWEGEACDRDECGCPCGHGEEEE